MTPKKLDNYVSRFTFVCKYMVNVQKEKDLVTRFLKANEIYDKISKEIITVSDDTVYVDGVQKISVKLSENIKLNKLNCLVCVNNINEIDNNFKEMHNINATNFVVNKFLNHDVLMSQKVYDEWLENNPNLNESCDNNIRIYVGENEREFTHDINKTYLQTYLNESTNIILFGGDLIEELSNYIDNVTVIKSSITPLESNKENVLNLVRDFEKTETNKFATNNQNEVVAFHKLYEKMGHKHSQKISDSLLKQLLLNYYLRK